jgi:hypothetical protein
VYGRIQRGEFVRIAYQLGRTAATGELRLAEDLRTTHAIQLRRGYMTSARVDGHWAPLGELLRKAGVIDEALLQRSLEAVAATQTLQGRALRAAGVPEAALEAALRRQAELRLEQLAAIPSASYRFAANVPATARGGLPLSLTTWARRHLEARVDAIKAAAILTELAGARLSLRKDLAPEPVDCDDTDRRILAALATPRRLDELERTAHAPRLRLCAFVHFLRSVGALDQRGVAAPIRSAGPGEVEARRLLGVGVSAGPDEIKRAYRRLARLCHPDMHPGAEGTYRRALESRFAGLTAAYRQLLI